MKAKGYRHKERDSGYERYRDISLEYSDFRERPKFRAFAKRVEDNHRQGNSAQHAKSLRLSPRPENC